MKVVSAREMAKSGGDSGASFVTTVGDPRAIEATRRKLVLNEEEMRSTPAPCADESHRRSASG